MSDIRSIEEIQEDIRTLTRVPSMFINVKLNTLADEVGRKFSLESKPRGTWNYIIDGCECSVCDYKFDEHIAKFNYCPNCGARMDGVE